ncbi:MAG: RagB/SusD family nutrient uptake outer membrane protein [Bacteroidales bacterium]|nr:RagB/SusD family nutrient uptake outer membrane protein [Bacteroidales bacterium]
MKKISNKIIAFCASAAAALSIVGCNDWLDVKIDDGSIASIDNAFNMRSTAIRYLATCYSYMTEEGNFAQDPAMLGGDELWDLPNRLTTTSANRVPRTMFNIARGFQTASSPYANDWASMYEALRCCNIFFENIDNVPDLKVNEKNKWVAEVKFLKAYYHFHLVRKWGPVPIIRENLPLNVSPEEARVYRTPIDTCFDHILSLLDEALACEDLPVVNPSTEEYGRVSKSIVAAFKAKVAVYAASPLFNGNDELASLVDNTGRQLFPAKSDEEKKARWEYAVQACEEAISMCEGAGKSLHVFNDYPALSDTLKQELTLRGVTCVRWNHELIWGNTQADQGAMGGFQAWALPDLTGGNRASAWGYNILGVPMKVADQFYTDNGLPMNYDASWAGINPLEVVEATVNDDPWHLQAGYQTARKNFRREPRFYADLCFDGGRWGMYGSTLANVDCNSELLFSYQCRMNGPQSQLPSNTGGTLTGYFAKKLFPYQMSINTSASPASLTTYWYPWPMIRLADLYLLYAEAVNEYEGPSGAHSQMMFNRIDAVRERAGIPGVKESWDTYSTAPGRYNSQTGMREIIHRERLIELAFESQRFWDLRRWKEAPAVYSQGIWGYYVKASSPEEYYRIVQIAEQPFTTKNYFWPIMTSNIERNTNLVQNIGW